METQIRYPKQKIILFENNIRYIVHGQGVFLFESINDSNKLEKCSFSILNNDNTDGLEITFQVNSIKVNRISTTDSYVDPNCRQGLSHLNGAYYWFSLDSHNQTFYAGIGEARLETCLYKYKFEFTKDQDNERKANIQFLEDLINIKIIKNIKPIRLLRDPITENISLLVKNTNDLTMENVANGKFMPRPNLSTMAQKLYDCIAGNKFILNTPDFPDFSKAIEYSIASKDGWCNKKLKEKSTEFNKDKPNTNETYLRITLGQNNGESPGIPYVMEIWPVAHYSPIHNHGSAEAIIRVLHGSINVSLFPFLCGDKVGVEPFGNVNFNKNDITWISPTLNQTHQLKNLENNKSTCITIQCYMYDQENIKHYDYFDYIDDDGNIKQYEPDSDMDFIEFKKQMKLEWDNRPNKSIIERIIKFFRCL